MEAIEKKYWHIRQVADMLSEPTTTIRFWCDRFRLPVPRNKRNERRFTSANIVQLTAISRAVRSGEYTLKGIEKRVNVS